MSQIHDNSYGKDIFFDELYELASLIIDLSGNRISGMEDLRITDELIYRYNHGELDDNVKLKKYLSFLVDHHISVNDLAHSMYEVIEQLKEQYGREEFINILKNDLRIGIMMKYIKIFYSMYPYDAFSFDIENWIYTSSSSDSLLSDLSSFFGPYIDKDRYQYVTNHIKLLNREEFINILSNFKTIQEVVDVIDDKVGANVYGKNYIMVDTRFDIDLIRSSVIHESVHHLSTSDGKTGFFIPTDDGGEYRGLNESVTEYFTHKIMNFRHDKPNDRSSYGVGVYCINMLILYGYITEVELIHCYFKHDIQLFKHILMGNGLSEEQVEEIMINIEIASRAYPIGGQIPAEDEARVAANILRGILNDSIHYDSIRNGNHLC